MRSYFYRMQMKAGSDGNRIAEDMLKQGRITADIDYAGEQFNHLKRGDVILIHKGAFPISLVKIKNKIADNDLSDESFGIDYAIEVLSEYNNLSEQEQKEIDLWGNTPPTGTFFKINSGNNTFNRINTWHKIITKKKKMKNLLELIHYKKQVILQGPPGTGKTREAKIIASKLVANNFKDISILSNQVIREVLQINTVIKSVAGNVTYKIVDLDSDKVTLLRENGTTDKTTFSKIIEFYNNRKWDDSFNDNDSRRAAALARHIYDTLTDKQKKNYDSKYVKFIQFHPAFSYEDFVRGIVAECNGTKINYVTKDKLLADFAKEAYKNWKESHEPKEKVAKETWVKKTLEDFKDFLSEEIENREEKLMITGKAYINRITENSIRYNSDAWEVDGGVPDSDIIKMYLAETTTRKQIRDNTELTKTAKSLSTYWLKILMLFKKYVDDNNLKPIENTESITEKKYVLIIDEINRANLPAVLGELIYALEYRGDKVESMYPIDDDNTLIIPPNLYIIGTMNTSDRSVGHIDYAIRRRFAFIDILPKVLEGDSFELELFKQVSALFIQNLDEYLQDSTVELKLSEHLSEEFRPEDVWLGHSYFIKGKEDFELRKKFEIIPILKEYVKDGILKKSALEVIEKL